jgi:hypothetical protein
MAAVLASALLASLLLTPPRPAALAADGDQPVAMKIPAPDFVDVTDWVNSKPLTWDKLRGQVVVVHFWTFG